LLGAEGCSAGLSAFFSSFRLAGLFSLSGLDLRSLCAAGFSPPSALPCFGSDGGFPAGLPSVAALLAGLSSLPGVRVSRFGEADGAGFSAGDAAAPGFASSPPLRGAGWGALSLSLLTGVGAAWAPGAGVGVAIFRPVRGSRPGWVAGGVDGDALSGAVAPGVGGTAGASLRGVPPGAAVVEGATGGVAPVPGGSGGVPRGAPGAGAPGATAPGAGAPGAVCPAGVIERVCRNEAAA